MHADFIDFLKKSPTAWHAAEEIGRRLEGFTQVCESDEWQLEPGKGYFFQRGGAVVAFRMPTGFIERATILASHTDSPALRLKPRPLFRDKTMNLYRVEVYGGPTLSTWFDRDLGIAGRLFKDAGGQVSQELVFDKTPLTIPSIAIHLMTQEERKAFKIDKQKHTCPLVSLTGEEINPFADALSFDLYLVPLEEPRELTSGLLAGYRIDNLSSVYASLLAMRDAKATADSLQVSLFFNHEEIGSGTDEGAQSALLADLLDRVATKRIKARSLCVSLDVSHAYHPNFADKYDPLHLPLLGGGPIFKYNANFRYMTSAATAAPLIKLCRDNNLPYQEYASNNEIRCGSTVGPYIAASGIPTVDLGIPQLAMHSIRELMEISDLKNLTTLVCKLLTN